MTLYYRGIVIVLGRTIVKCGGFWYNVLKIDENYVYLGTEDLATVHTRIDNIQCLYPLDDYDLEYGINEVLKSYNNINMKYDGYIL